ncbi:MAG: M20/M25/M40 family metallo-hydrolase [Clostridia bacterium]|nr:M20/M25/M40 family metallo-hydrolase [Clostridia bacterium]
MDLKTLTEINAPAGHEQPIRRVLIEELRAKGFNPYIDRMGNVIVVKEGTGVAPRKRVMVSAHMDEVGLIVTGHAEGGFLKVTQAGGIDPRVLISKRVKVGDDNIPGVIGAVAIHLQSAADRARVMGYRDITVDIGANDKGEAERKAPIGTYISFDTPYVEYGDGYACGKAFDDRVGCWTILRLLEEELPCDLIAAFVSEEEVGCRGASGAAFSQEPDIGIVLEGTTCNDLGDIPEVAQVCKAGEGVAVSFMDGSSIANRDLFKKALEVGEKEGIAHQVKASVSGGNDGGVIQRAREGVPVVVLSVPCRYIHSPSTVVKLSDVEAQFELCRALLKTF